MKTSLPPLSSQVAGARYCFLDRAKGRQSDLQVVLAGREECRPDYRIFRESYPTHALEVVVAGTGVLQLGGKTQRLVPGMVFSYGPGIPHGISAEGPGLVKYFVDFTGRESDELLATAFLKPGRSILARHPDQIAALVDLILDRAGEKSRLNEGLCADYLRAILRLCTETLGKKRGVRGRDDCLRPALALINAEYLRIRSVSELSSRIGVTPEHLTRTFRRGGLQPPSIQLASKRMSHAAGLLLSGDAKVKQIAYELGFATPFHFSAAFKRHYGCSPRTLRDRRAPSA